MLRAADRGGSFGRIGKVWPRYGCTMDTLACRFPAESSPVRSVYARRMLLVIVATLTLFGCVTLADGVYIKAKAALAQVLFRGAWERARAGENAPRPWPWADTYPMARLRVRAHGIDLFVLSGATGRTLAFGPGHHDGSAMPGDEGNVVLSGHRDTHFRFLRDLHAGDALDIETARGRVYRYRVINATVVDYRKLVLPRWASQLTLVTCYPFDALTTGGPLRYVVTAIAESDSAPTSTLR